MKHMIYTYIGLTVFSIANYTYYGFTIPEMLYQCIYAAVLLAASWIVGISISELATRTLHVLNNIKTIRARNRARRKPIKTT